MKLIKPDNFKEPAGHYSPAVVSNGFVFVSGQVAADPETGEAVDGTVEEQTALCFENLARVLKASGSSVGSVVKVTIFISDESFWGPVNETYKGIFGDHKPARAIIPVGSFRSPFLIEVEAVAALDDI